MKRRLYSVLFLVLLLGCLAALVCLRALVEAALPAVSDEPETQTDAVPSSNTAAGAADAETAFTTLTDGVTETRYMDEYLVGVIAGEMPVSFDIEALKAQAVAARTYILYKTGRETPAHPEADVCGDASCCKAYLTDSELREKWGDSYAEYSEKLTLAVRETDGEYLSYGGEPIQAVFHASSAGETESSANVWSELPYLVSVSSPETEESVPNLISTVTVSADDFKATLLDAYPDMSLSGEPESWLGEVSATDTGRVASVTIGGKAVEGTAMRALFSLRSTDFTLEYDGRDFVFTVRGYGHGVGMSQYGANLLALQGLTYKEILAHYYPGTTLE